MYDKVGQQDHNKDVAKLVSDCRIGHKVRKEHQRVSGEDATHLIKELHEQAKSRLEWLDEHVKEEDRE